MISLKRIFRKLTRFLKINSALITVGFLSSLLFIAHSFSIAGLWNWFIAFKFKLPTIGFIFASAIQVCFLVIFNNLERRKNYWTEKEAHSLIEARVFYFGESVIRLILIMVLAFVIKLFVGF